MIVTQEYSKYFVSGYDVIEIPDLRNKAFFKGKIFNFSESISDFLKSDMESCIFPVYCEHESTNKAFKSVTLITYSEEIRFTNSEKGQYAYYRNNIKEIEQGNAYLIFLDKFARARNDCLVKAAMKIEPQPRVEKECHSFIGTDVEAMIEEMDKILANEKND